MVSLKKPQFRVLASFLTAGVVLWFSPLRTAHAELVVSSPSPARAKSLEAWYDHHIPVCFRARTRLDVRQLSDHQMTSYLDGAETQATSGDGDAPSSPSYSENSASSSGDNDNDDIDGVFEDNPPRIALRLPEDGAPDMLTFAHEYGHYVWFNILEKEDRDAYEAIYKRQRATHHLVTQYAASGLEEGFAEAFSFYVAEPAVLAHRDPRSYQFFSEWVSESAAADTHDNSER